MINDLVGVPPVIIKNGIPYDGPNVLAVDFLALPPADHFSQGLPMTAEGRLLVSVNAVDHFGAGAAPFTVTNELSAAIAAVDHFANGVPYTAAGQLAIGLAPP